MHKTQGIYGTSAFRSLPWTPLATGSWLITAGIRKGSLLGGILAATGGALLYHTVSRPGPGYSDRRPLFARGVKVRRSIHVKSSPKECYEFWRNLEHLPQFMDHLDSVRVLSPSRSRWVARSLAGMSIEWDSEIVKDVENRIIGWRSMPGSPLHTAGSVRFEPSEGGTEVVVTLKYDPPGGEFGAAIAELLGSSPARQIESELGRFRKIIEKRHAGNGRSLSDPVDRTSIESFPASDPPSWTPNVT